MRPRRARTPGEPQRRPQPNGGLLRRRLLRLGLLSGGVLSSGLLSLGGRLAAQQAAPPAAPAPLAYPGIPETTADTGRMVPGWHDFSRYPWGGQFGMCLMAANQALPRLWRHAEWDTAEASVRDTVTLPPAIPQLLTRCGVPQLLPALEQQVLRGEGEDGGTAMFGGVYSAALFFGQDSTAAALLRAAIAHAPTLATRLGVLWSVWGADFTMYPRRLAWLERDLALAESVARPLPVYQDSGVAQLVLIGREWVYHHWVALGDTAHMRASAEAYIAACARFDPRDGTMYCGQAWGMHLQGAFNVLLDLAILEHGLRSREAVEVLTRQVRNFTHDSTARGKVTPFFLYLGKPFVWPETPYWYSPSGGPLPAPAPRGRAPMPSGKVTLIWNPAWPGLHDGSAPRSEQVVGFVGLLHKLLAKYGPQGLQLAVIEQARGMAAGVGAVEPEQEAPAVRQLFQEEFQLPAFVVVDTVPHRLMPDGRRQDGYSAWERYYLPGPMPAWREVTDVLHWSPWGPMLLDKQGRVRMLGLMGFGIGPDDPMLEFFIQQLLKEP